MAAALIANVLVLMFSAELFGWDSGSRNRSGFAQATVSRQTRQPGRATDLKSLTKRLRGAGASVRAGGRVSQPFFSVPGRELFVNGQQVQVFVYRTAARANADARKVSSDGSPIGTSMIRWAAPPHFFKNGVLVVIYVGENPSVLEALRNALGPQFAGK